MFSDEYFNRSTNKPTNIHTSLNIVYRVKVLAEMLIISKAIQIRRKMLVFSQPKTNAGSHFSDGRYLYQIEKNQYVCVLRFHKESAIFWEISLFSQNLSEA